MWNLFLAEWKKVTKNRTFLSFTIGIIPIGTAAYFFATIILAILSPEFVQNLASPPNKSQWSLHIVQIWGILLNYPTNVLSGMLFLAFMAVVFGSEYQWNTWKNLIPRRSRFALIVTKFFTLTVVIMSSLILTSCLFVVGNGLIHLIAGIPYGPALSVVVLKDVFNNYVLEMFLTMISLLILSGFAAWSVLLTRSVVGGVLAGFGFSVIDPIAFFGLLTLSVVLEQESLMSLYRFFPSYNIENLRSLLVSGTSYNSYPEILVSGNSMGSTLFILALWSFSFMGLAIYVFQRQDIS